MEQDNLESRFGLLEERLARIENALLASPYTAGVFKNANKQSIVQHSAPQSGSISLATLADQLPEPKIKKEKKPGNWLGFISVLCFIFAAAFIIKLSIDSGWLTPARQIGIATLLGLGLIGFGLRMAKSDKEYAAFLPGAGVVVLFLTVFGAHSLYQITSFETALGLMIAVSGICIWLYTKMNNNIYVITSASGAYLAPVLFGDTTMTGAFLLYYFLICSLTFAIISIWLQSRLLVLLSAYLAIFLTSIINMEAGRDALTAIFLALHFIIFSFATYFYSCHHKKSMESKEAWSFMPVLLLFYAVEYSLIDKLYPGIAPWLSLGFCGLLIGLYLSAKRYFPDGLGSQTLIISFATLVGFHSFYLEIMPDDLKPWLFVAIFVTASFTLRERIHSTKGMLIPIIAILLILTVEYGRMVTGLYEGQDSLLIVSFAALASMWLFMIPREGQEKPQVQKDYGYLLLISAHILAVTALYRLTESIGSLAVSSSWLVYGAGVMIFAFTRKDEMMARSAILVLSFAGAKALLFDVSSEGPVLRIICLLLTGAVLYGCGALMRRVSGWKTST